MGSSAHAGVDPRVACKEKKAKATAKKAADLLKAFGKNEKKPNPTKLAVDISKAQSKFTKSFIKAENASGCLTSGDADGIGSKVDAFVDDALAWFSLVCGNGRIDPGEWCDSPALGICDPLFFAGCVPPGRSDECRCCVADGWSCSDGLGEASCCNPESSCIQLGPHWYECL
jgi:hypothetical protein